MKPQVGTPKFARTMAPSIPEFNQRKIKNSPIPLHQKLRKIQNWGKSWNKEDALMNKEEKEQKKRETESNKLKYEYEMLNKR